MPRRACSALTVTRDDRPRGKPRGRRRDRDCVTCKARGIKCDLNRPQCLPCVQAGLACGGYAMRVVWLEERRLSTSAEAKGVQPSRLSTRTATSPASPAPATKTTTSPTLAYATPYPYPSSPPAAFPVSPAASPRATTIAATATSTSCKPADNSWCETDQNSLIMRLAALCSHILTTEAATAADEALALPTSNAAQQNDYAIQQAANQAIVAHPSALPSTTTAGPGTVAGQANQYLSLPDTVDLLSDLCVFIQVRLEGRSLAPRQLPADSLELAKHRLTALAHVNRAIAAANPFAFLGIATFAVFEVCDDTAFGEWKRHVYGARHLLDYHRCQTLADLHRLAALVPGLMDILARLVWFDVSGTVVHGAVDGPMLSTARGDNAVGATSPVASTHGLIFDDWHRQVLLDDEFFATVGVAADTCALYVDVAKERLAYQPVQACLRAAEQLLRVATGPTLSDWELASNVNRCAAALAILRQAQAAQAVRKAHERRSNGAENYPNEENEQNDQRESLDEESVEEDIAWESTTAAALDKLCSALAATPASSRFYIHLAVTAYVAGMQARTRQQCAVIRQYWRNCNVFGICRYPGALSRCEEHWRRMGLADHAEAKTG